MITVEQYFTKPRPREHQLHSERLLEKVNRLLTKAVAAGVYKNQIDPDTGTQISGTHGGDGDGGYRTPGSRTGATRSRHKFGGAVDVYDPDNSLDEWLTDEILEEFGLYREHPNYTKGWCHLQDNPPGSGLHTYIPY